MPKAKGDPRARPRNLVEVIDSTVQSARLDRDDPRLRRFLSMWFPPKYREWLKNSKRINAVIGGNRSGKTTLCIYKAIIVYTGIIPDIMKDYITFSIPRDRPRHVRIILYSYTKHWPEAIRPKLLDDSKEGMLPRAWSHWDNDARMFVGPDGSYLSILSVDPRERVEVTHLRAPYVDLTLIDEVNQEAVLDESLMRCAELKDGPRCVDLAYCPQEGFDWTYDRIYKKYFDTWTHEPLPEDKRDPNINAIRVTSYENPVAHKESVDRAKETIKEEEVPFRIYGLYASRSGNLFFQVNYLDDLNRMGAFTAGTPYVYTPIEVDWTLGVYRGELRKTDPRTADPEDPRLWWIWEVPAKDRSYMMTIDTSEGLTTSDKQCADVWDVTDPLSVKQVAQFNATGIKAEEFIDMCCAVGMIYNTAFIVAEVNNTTGGIARMKLATYPSVYHAAREDEGIAEETKKIGWMTTNKTKPEMMQAAYDLIDSWQKRQYIGIKSVRTYRELVNYESRTVSHGFSTRRVFGPRRGRFDDTVMSFAMMAYVVSRQYHLVPQGPIELVREKEKKPLDRSVRGALKVVKRIEELCPTTRSMQ